MRAVTLLVEVFAFLFLSKAKREGSEHIIIAKQTRLNLRDVTRNAVSKNFDPVLGWEEPSIKDMLDARQRIIAPMKSLTSPVFFSTGSDGRHEGLSYISNLQPDVPVLFVSNHQLVGFDSFLVVNELIEQCNIFVRSLTHPFLYPTDNPDGTSFLETFGCLPVSTRNFYRLLQSQQPILLFPGGARESFVQSQKEAYQLVAWSDTKADFVRAAAKFGATIIPFSSIGAAESAFFANEFVQEGSISTIQSILQAAAGQRAPTNARYDASRSLQNNRINFPLVFPKPLPSRHYFLFHEPVHLANVNHKDRGACGTLYKSIKQTIQNGCQDLLRAKQRDQFDDPLLRVPYEQFWRKQAPTFAPNLLNS